MLTDVDRSFSAMHLVRISDVNSNYDIRICLPFHKALIKTIMKVIRSTIHRFSCTCYYIIILLCILIEDDMHDNEICTLLHRYYVS